MDAQAASADGWVGGFFWTFRLLNPLSAHTSRIGVEKHASGLLVFLAFFLFRGGVEEEKV